MDPISSARKIVQPQEARTTENPLQETTEPQLTLTSPPVPESVATTLNKQVEVVELSSVDKLLHPNSELTSINRIFHFIGPGSEHLFKPNEADESYVQQFTTLADNSNKNAKDQNNLFKIENIPVENGLEGLSSHKMDRQTVVIFNTHGGKNGTIQLGKSTPKIAKAAEYVHKQGCNRIEFDCCHVRTAAREIKEYLKTLPIEDGLAVVLAGGTKEASTVNGSIVDVQKSMTYYADKHADGAATGDIEAFIAHGPSPQSRHLLYKPPGVDTIISVRIPGQRDVKQKQNIQNNPPIYELQGSSKKHVDGRKKGTSLENEIDINTETILQAAADSLPLIKDPEKISKEKQFILLERSYRGGVADVKALIEGVNVNTRGPRGATPLEMAISGRHKDVVDLLLTSGV